MENKKKKEMSGEKETTKDKMMQMKMSDWIKRNKNEKYDENKKNDENPMKNNVKYDDEKMGYEKVNNIDEKEIITKLKNEENTGNGRGRKNSEGIIDEKKTKSKFRHVRKKFEEKCEKHAKKLDNTVSFSYICGPHFTPRERTYKTRKSTLTPSSVNFSGKTAAKGDMDQYLIDIKPINTELSGCEKLKSGSRIISSGKTKLNIKENIQSEGQISPNKIPKLTISNLKSRLGVTLERLPDAQKMGEKK